MREAERLDRSRNELLGMLRAEEHRLAALLAEGVAQYNARNNALSDLIYANQEIKSQLEALRGYANKLDLSMRPAEAATVKGDQS